jgi:hypothetical protein
MELRAVVAEGHSELRGYECDRCRAIAFREVENVGGAMNNPTNR